MSDRKMWPMSEPIIFDAAHPLVIRPVEPHGFILETYDGQAIYHCTVPFEQARFTLRPAPARGIVVTVDLAWEERDV